MGVLREVVEADLPVFYEHQLGPEATAMAAFPTRERDAFMAHWAKTLANDSALTCGATAQATNHPRVTADATITVYGPCTIRYPFASSNARTNIKVAESTELRCSPAMHVIPGVAG